MDSLPLSHQGSSYEVENVYQIKQKKLLIGRGYINFKTKSKLKFNNDCGALFIFFIDLNSLTLIYNVQGSTFFVLHFILLILLECSLPGSMPEFVLKDPDSSVGKESTCNAEDPGSIPGLGRSAGEGIGCPLQYSWANEFSKGQHFLCLQSNLKFNSCTSES